MLGKLLMSLGILAIIYISIMPFSVEDRICYYGASVVLFSVGYYFIKPQQTPSKDRYFHFVAPLILLVCGITEAAITKPTNSRVLAFFLGVVVGIIPCSLIGIILSIVNKRKTQNSLGWIARFGLTTCRYDSRSVTPGFIMRPAFLRSLFLFQFFDLLLFSRGLSV
jgi:sulfite exporter TauE/SafE